MVDLKRSQEGIGDKMSSQTLYAKQLIDIYKIFSFTKFEIVQFDIKEDIAS